MPTPYDNSGPPVIPWCSAQPGGRGRLVYLADRGDREVVRNDEPVWQLEAGQTGLAARPSLPLEDLRPPPCHHGRRSAEVAWREHETQRHDANRAALRERQQQLTPVVVRQVAAQTGTKPWTLPGEFEHAMGVSIVLAGRVVAVICPVTSQITAQIAVRLADVSPYVASEHEQSNG